MIRLLRAGAQFPPARVFEVCAAFAILIGRFAPCGLTIPRWCPSRPSHPDPPRIRGNIYGKTRLRIQKRVGSFLRRITGFSALV